MSARASAGRFTETLEPWLDAWGGEADELYVSHHGAPVARVRHTFKRKGAVLGFPEMTPYSLRHKMATELRARGVSREELAYQMGRDRAIHPGIEQNHRARAFAAIAFSQDTLKNQPMWRNCRAR